MRQWLGRQPRWVTGLVCTLMYGLIVVAFNAVTGKHGIDWAQVVFMTVVWGAFWTGWMYWQDRRTRQDEGS